MFKVFGTQPSDFRPQEPASRRSGRVESEFEVKNCKFLQLEPKTLKKPKIEKHIFGFFGHNSVPGPRIWTKLGGFCSQGSPGPFETAPGPK